MTFNKTIEKHINNNKLNPNTFKQLKISPEEAYKKHNKINSPICNCGKPLKFISFKKGYAKEHNYLCKYLVNGKVDKKYIDKDFLLKYLFTTTLRKKANYSKYFDLSNKEIFDILNEIKTEPLCKCGKELKFNQSKKEYFIYCSRKCISKYNTKNIIIETKEDIIKNNLITNGKLNSSISKFCKKSNEELYNIFTNDFGFCKKHKNHLKFDSFAQGYLGCKDCEKELKENNKEKRIQEKFKYIQKNCVVNNSINYPEVQKYLNLKHSQFYVMLNKLGLSRNKSKSLAEEEIGFLIPNSKLNIRGIIGLKELDIYSEKYSFAIEYNGDMWHSFGYSKYKVFNKEEIDENRHLIKTELCEEKDIQLFHIFESEWKNPLKKDIWKSNIGKIMGTNKILFADDCEIKESSEKEAKEFLETNHLEGYKKSSINIGLYLDEEIVSLMSFNADKKEYILERFSDKIFFAVKGGLPKILSYLEEKYSYTKITTNLNRRWESPDFLISFGFEFKKYTKPNSFYFTDEDKTFKTKSDLQFIFAEDFKTDKDIIKKGYRVIYDSGYAKLTKEYK